MEFARRWYAGEPIGAISAAMNRSEPALKTKRVRLRLPARRKLMNSTETRVWLRPEIHAVYASRSAAEGTTISEQMRRVLESHARETG